jgi:hypothetical protein
MLKGEAALYGPSHLTSEMLSERGSQAFHCHTALGCANKRIHKMSEGQGATKMTKLKKQRKNLVRMVFKHGEEQEKDLIFLFSFYLPKHHLLNSLTPTHFFLLPQDISFHPSHARESLTFLMSNDIALYC